MTSETSSISGPPRKGAWACYKYGWRFLKRYFLELLIVVVLAGLAAIPMSYPFGTSWIGGTDFFVLIYLFLFYLPLHYGVDFVFLKAARDESPRVGDMLIFLNNYFNVVLAHLLVSVFVVIGLVMAIVPGIIIMCKLAFVPYLLTREQTDAFDALRLSWRMTRGNAWKIFRIGLLGIPVSLAGLIAFGVGILVSIIWIYLALASLYYAVSRESDELQTYLAHQQRYSKSRQHTRDEGSGRDDEGLPNLLDRE